MQRQSLGSPGRERQSLSPNDAVLKLDDIKRRESSSSLPSDVTTADHDEIKPEKPLRRCNTSPEKFIHLIPVLVLFCFLILYFSSHVPSPQDMAEFHGFKHPQHVIDTTDIDDIGRVRSEKSLRRSDAFVIRSLQEDFHRESSHKIRGSTNRKLGDF